MKNTLSLLFVLIFNQVIGLDYSENQNLDHQFFLKKIEHANENIYNETIIVYNNYLSEHPNDIQVHIEKCKFIEYAVYDEYNDYNPNQEYLDSCVSVLIEVFPNHPDLLIYRSERLWGDGLTELLEKALDSASKNPKDWNDRQEGLIYSKMANQYYVNNNKQKAYYFIRIACELDKSHTTSLLYANILIDLEKNDEASKVLLSAIDSTESAWELNQIADLLVQLKLYSNALFAYNKINRIDSTYNSNQEVAKVMVGIKQYPTARTFLLKDIDNYWDKEAAALKLFLHDFNYHGADTALMSYNQYREFGYNKDPLALYRLKLFFAHPTLKWNFRDFLGIITLLLITIALILLPSTWILPIYFIGHHWKLMDRNLPHNFEWGLKSFWWISSGFLMASFLSTCIFPESIYATINDSENITTKENLGLMSISFFIITAITSFSTLLHKNLRRIFSIEYWSVGMSIGYSLIYFIGFKIISGIYIKLGMLTFNLTAEDIGSAFNFLLASREQINAIASTYGGGIAFMFVAFIVPIYEEIIFRGVILDACNRYLNFKWANIIQATLFATIHQNLFLFPVFFTFAITTGLLKRKSSSIYAGIFFHIINNALALGYLLSK